LLPQKQDLDILILLGSMTQPDEVEQQRERLGEKKEKHAGRCCTDHAERQTESENVLDSERWKGSPEPQMYFPHLTGTEAVASSVCGGDEGTDV